LYKFLAHCDFKAWVFWSLHLSFYSWIKTQYGVITGGGEDFGDQRRIIIRRRLMIMEDAVVKHFYATMEVMMGLD
jgi:hypothetical protein